MKYIHILDEFSLAGGGVRSVVSDVCQEMAKRDLDVYIYPLGIPQGSSEVEFEKWGNERGIKIKLMRKNGESLIKAISRIRNNIKILSIEDRCCLFLHLKRGVLAGILGTLCIKNVRRVEVFHSNYINYGLQARVCRPFINHHLAVSKESQQQLIGYGIKPPKTTLAYNGINPEKIRGEVSVIKRDDSLFRVISIGRMARQKNLQTAIAAFCSFCKGDNKVKSEYLIAGDGPQREECEKLAEGKIKFLGMITRSEVYSQIAVADAVIFPSLWEGHSIALLEVLAIGSPVIVTDIPAFREVLGNEPLSDDELFRPGPFGVVFHKENIQSCQSAISYMAHHREDYMDMKNYVQSLSENYTIKKQVDIYVRAAEFNTL